MSAKQGGGASTWVDPDDAPELTEEHFEKADWYDGERLIQRGRGRPKLAAPKEQINIRLDADVLAALRQSGPGWQTKINEILRASLGLGELQDVTDAIE